MGQIKAILLDVMETLVTEPFWHALPDFFGKSRDALLEELHPTSWIEFEEGKITEEEYLATFFKDGRPVDAAGLRSCLVEAYQWLDGIPSLLDELRQAGYPMHALSNYPIWYELIEQKLGLSHYLDWTFVSCRTGLRKPDERAYLHAAQHLGVKPDECLFIDDRPVNISAAQSLGIDAILKQDFHQLRHDLIARGLLSG
jgi:epoxide hydrolase-like predicted phosphatase